MRLLCLISQVCIPAVTILRGPTLLVGFFIYYLECTKKSWNISRWVGTLETPSCAEAEPGSNMGISSHCSPQALQVKWVAWSIRLHLEIYFLVGLLFQ